MPRTAVDESGDAARLQKEARRLGASTKKRRPSCDGLLRKNAAALPIADCYKKFS